jgi:hypothetical protein
VEALVLLGHKYDTPFLRNKALERLLHCFPNTLKLWDGTIGRDAGPNPMKYIRLSSCLQIARTVNYPAAIPPIMLSLCSLGLEKLTEAPIAREDMKTVLTVFWSLQKRQRVDALKWLHFVPQGCSGRSECVEARMRLSKRFENNLFPTKPTWTMTSKLKDSFWENSGLCSACVHSSQMIYGTERQRIWNDLPMLFGFPPWEDLRRQSKMPS